MATKVNLPGSIKLNLLPAYVGLQTLFKRVLLACLALLLLVAGAMGLMYLANLRKLEKVNQDVANISTVAALTTAADTAQKDAESQSSSLKTVVDFMADASKTGPERAALLDLVRRYIYKDAVISALDLSDGANLRLTATVRTPDDYARLLNALRLGAQPSGPLFGSPPVANGIPGFPEGRALLEQVPQGVSYTPQPIIYPLKIDAAGALKVDQSTSKSLMVVPVEPPGTSVGAVAGAGGAGGAAGGSGAYPSSSSSSSSRAGSSSSSANPSPSGAPAR